MMSEVKARKLVVSDLLTALSDLQNLIWVWRTSGVAPNLRSLAHAEEIARTVIANTIANGGIYK